MNKEGRKAGTDTDTDAALPPHSEEAERGVLGCILLEPDNCLSAAEEAGMAADWFYVNAHGLLWERMAQLRKMGKPVDTLTLFEICKVSDCLDQVGGMSFITSLPNEVVSAANFAYYAEILRERRIARKLLQVCHETMCLVREHSGPVDALLGRVENAFLAVTEPAAKRTEQTIKDVLRDVVDEMENYHKGKLQINGLPTGLEYLDKVIGGIGANYYTVLAGRPGSGKTTLAIDIIKHLAMDYEWWEAKKVESGGVESEMVKRKGIPVGVFSLEMTNKSLGRRLLFSVARVSAGHFRQGFASSADWSALAAAAGRVNGTNIYLDDAGAQTIGQICAKARRWAKQYGIKLFVIDYLQLVLPDKRAGRIDRVQELTDISAAFVQLKKALNIPWLVLAQMNRNIETSETKRPPVLSDLKDSGAIEQDADVVMFLYQPERKAIEEDNEQLEDKFANVEWSERPQRINITVAKNRDGASGIAKLLFHKNQFHFEDWRKWQVANGCAQPAKGESYKEGSQESGVRSEDLL